MTGRNDFVAGANNSNTNHTELNAFSFDNKKVRVFEDKLGNPLFIVKDAIAILDLENITWATNGLDDDELTLVKLKLGKQNRNYVAVTESGLYALIFKSRKPEAKRFRKWVTSEVLPEIRKKGFYTPAHPETEGLFAGLEFIEHNGKRYYLYTEVLRILGFSTKSGTTYNRCKFYPDAFIAKFKRKFISEEYGIYLSKQKLRLDAGSQLLLPFNQYQEKGAANV